MTSEKIDVLKRGDKEKNRITCCDFMKFLSYFKALKYTWKISKKLSRFPVQHSKAVHFDNCEIW